MSTLDEEKERIWHALEVISRRVTAIELSVTAHHEEMRKTVGEAVKENMPIALLSTDEHMWVQLAIKKESQTIAFRRAVIEKTTIGLIFALFGWAGFILKEFFIAHGWKP